VTDAAIRECWAAEIEFQGHGINRASRTPKLIVEEALHVGDYCCVRTPLCYNEMTGHV